MSDKYNAPATIEEAVDLILAEISEDVQQQLAAASEDSLSAQHMGLSLWIRNTFLYPWLFNADWSNSLLRIDLLKQPLSKSYHDDSDSIAMEFLRATWRRLQEKPVDTA